MSYEEKFADFIRLCEERPKGSFVVIHNPHALDDRTNCARSGYLEAGILINKNGPQLWRSPSWMSNT